MSKLFLICSQEKKFVLSFSLSLKKIKIKIKKTSLLAQGYKEFEKHYFADFLRPCAKLKSNIKK